MTSPKDAAHQPLNPTLDALVNVRAKVAELQRHTDEITAQIRSGFVDVALVFVDMVDSTQFKQDHAANPEKWILRVRQFCEIVAEYAKLSRGKVVKYIGDEVMVMFDSKEAVADATAFIMRRREMQETLTDVTGVDTRIKIAVDKGLVFLLQYEGHEALDPQGTPVDRCARIAKFAKPGTVVTSWEFAKYCESSITWTPIGSPVLKGLGPTNVYQLGSPTLRAENMVEDVTVAEYDKLKADFAAANSKVEELTMAQKKLVDKNNNLAAEFKKLGQTPPAKDVVKSPAAESKQQKAEEAWGHIESMIEELRSTVHQCPTSSFRYAQFLFLSLKDEGLSEDSFNGVEFQGLKDIEIVVSLAGGNYYGINADHRLNKKAIDTMRRLGSALEVYENRYREEDDGDMYAYSLTDAQFWSERIGLNVSR